MNTYFRVICSPLTDKSEVYDVVAEHNGAVVWVAESLEQADRVCAGLNDVLRAEEK